MSNKYVYFFGGSNADGDATHKEPPRRQRGQPRRDGQIGLPVPAGFTLTTEVCTYYYDHGQQLPARAARPRSTRP